PRTFHPSPTRPSSDLPQLTLRPSAALSFKVTGGYAAGRTMAQIVTKQADDADTATLGTRYVFAELVQHQFYVTLRANMTFSPSLDRKSTRLNSSHQII